MIDPLTETPAAATEPLVEILDLARRTVAVMPAGEARRQKLCHRTIAILLYDEAGRLHLRKRDGVRGQPRDRWDTSVRAAVHAGESLLDAATRALEAELGIHAERMRLILELPASPENNNEFLHVFTLTRPELSAFSGQDQDSRDYCFTPEELDCLLRDFRELVSSRFLLLAGAMSLKGQWLRRP